MFRVPFLSSLNCRIGSLICTVIQFLYAWLYAQLLDASYEYSLIFICTVIYSFLMDEYCSFMMDARSELGLSFLYTHFHRVFSHFYSLTQSQHLRSSLPLPNLAWRMRFNYYGVTLPPKFRQIFFFFFIQEISTLNRKFYVYMLEIQSKKKKKQI